MSSNFSYWKESWLEFHKISNQLRECLNEERMALISLNMERIVQSNLRKESLLGKIKRTKHSLQLQLKALFEVSKIHDLSEHLDSEADRREWEVLLKNWTQDWNSISALCENNQGFIQHSLKNLGVLVENLKRLFGENTVYSSSGGRKDSTTQGQVVEASY